MHAFKNCNSCVHRIVLRKQLIQILNFFGTLSGKLIEILPTFFQWSVKKAIYACRIDFGRKTKFEKNLVSFGTNSRYECQFWILHVQKTKNISSCKLFNFLCRKLFRFSANFLWQSCQTCNLCDRKCFPTNWYRLRKLDVCIHNFRGWADDIWIFVGFLAGLSKLHSACAEA